MTVVGCMGGSAKKGGGGEVRGGSGRGATKEMLKKNPLINKGSLVQRVRCSREPLIASVNLPRNPSNIISFTALLLCRGPRFAQRAIF